jgi:hypothetical protein
MRENSAHPIRSVKSSFRRRRGAGSIRDDGVGNRAEDFNVVMGKFSKSRDDQHILEMDILVVTSEKVQIDATV